MSPSVQCQLAGGLSESHHVPSASSTRRTRHRGAGQAPVPFHVPYVGRAEEQAVLRALRDGTLEGNGPIGQAVEAQLQRLLGVRYAFLMSSCTAAMEVALAAVGVAGGEVILPSFSFPSVAASVVAAGARPVFADIDPRHLTLDPIAVEQQLSSRTRAVIFVDYGGSPGTLDAIGDVTNRLGLPLIEDAAHALGARLRGRPLGSFGTVGCVSFHETKVVTCGEGGVFLTDDEAMIESASVAREYGTNRTAFQQGLVDHYEWVGIGWSRLLADPLAALLRAQLDALPTILRRRRAIAARYFQAFAPLAAAGTVQLPVLSPDVENNGHVFHLLLPSAHRADALIDALARARIDARRHFVPLHRSAYAQRAGFATRRLPVTESVAARLVRLPIYPSLTDAQQQRVIEAIVRALCAEPSLSTI